MARIRTVKPEFFRHYDLYMAEKEERLPLRLAFAGLWTVADREGRFRWKPKEIKLDCLPHDDLDFSRVLDALAKHGFVERYCANNVNYGWIPSFSRHQVINNRERPSELPDPLDATSSTREARVSDLHVQVQGEGKGKGRETEDASVTRERPAEKRRPSRSAPKTFVVSDQLKRWATETRPDLDIAIEIEKFLDYEFKDPKSDWDKTFRNWIRNGKPGGKLNGAKPQKTNNGSVGAATTTECDRSAVEAALSMRKVKGYE